MNNVDNMYELVMEGHNPAAVMEQTPLGRLIKKNLTSQVVPQAPRKPVQRPNFNVDEAFAKYLETGDLSFLDEGIFDKFKSAASKAVGFVKHTVGGGAPKPRRIGPSVDIMPGPKMLGPGPKVHQLSGGVNLSKHPQSAYASSRMLSAPEPKTASDQHPINHELFQRDYSPAGHYSHPDDEGQKTHSVWMQHERSWRGHVSSSHSDQGGQVHVEHDVHTGHPTGNWHYLHPPENHTWHGSPEHFSTHPDEHGSLEHVSNKADWSHDDAEQHVSSWFKENHGKHQVSAHGLGQTIDELSELKDENAHTGGRYQSDEDSALDRHGWSEAYHENHSGHEKYEFANDPKTIYSQSSDDRHGRYSHHDDEDEDGKAPNLTDHEIHLHASGKWEHYNHNGHKVASSEDGGDLSHYLKYGIKDAVGASGHDKDDEEEDFPDHE